MSDTKNDTPDPFDAAALRLPPSLEQEAGIKKPLMTVPVRKPHRQEWIRVNADPAYRGNYGTICLKEEKDEHYLVHPDLVVELEEELKLVAVYTVINRAGIVFLWPCRLPSKTRRVDLWASTAHECAEVAMERLIRIQANQGPQAYEYSITENPHNEPVWPTKSLTELMKLGFQKTGLYVDSIDHPVIRQLRNAD